MRVRSFRIPWKSRQLRLGDHIETAANGKLNPAVREDSVAPASLLIGLRALRYRVQLAALQCRGEYLIVLAQVDRWSTTTGVVISAASTPHSVSIQQAPFPHAR